MKNIYFIGIKGSGMASLAKILSKMGNNVYGSDIPDFIFTQTELIQLGIKIFNFSTNNFMTNKPDIIIVGNAFNEFNNVEVAYLHKNKVNYVSYTKFLSKFLNQYISIAISGTHGKTTTTSLIDLVMSNLPTISLIGDGTGTVRNINPKYFIFEACEYRDHFLSYYPDYLIINNIEWDHPDYFKNIEQVLLSFYNLLTQVKKEVICYGDDKNIVKLVNEFTNSSNNKLTIKKYGFCDTNDYIVQNYKQSEPGMSFNVKDNILNKYYKYELPFYGQHMLLNALNAIILGLEFKIDSFEINKLLNTYSGVKRRFNIKYLDNYIIINDYAHHPSEILATFESIDHKFRNHKKVLIFQQHTYTRTKYFLQQYIESIRVFDYVYLTEIYGSPRENKDSSVEKLLQNKVKNSHFLSMNNLHILKKYCKDNFVLIFMGAGDIEKYLHKFEKISNN